MRPEQTVKDCHGPLISVNPPEEGCYLQRYLG